MHGTAYGIRALLRLRHGRRTPRPSQAQSTQTTRSRGSWRAQGSGRERWRPWWGWWAGAGRDVDMSNELLHTAHGVPPPRPAAAAAAAAAGVFVVQLASAGSEQTGVRAVGKARACLERLRGLTSSTSPNPVSSLSAECNAYAPLTLGGRIITMPEKARGSGLSPSPRCTEFLVHPHASVMSISHCATNNLAAKESTLSSSLSHAQRLR